MERRLHERRHLGGIRVRRLHERRHLGGIRVRRLLADAAGRMPAKQNAVWKPALVNAGVRWPALIAALIT